ncbi:MAG: hypothetical protein JNM00_05815 [Flavobacteriales bacterium]|nr:hypothetical protein [Flavobacteriales bacterium]
MVCWLFGCAVLMAQPSLPDKYTWETDADFRRDSALVVQCLRWLTDADEVHSAENWSETNAFVMMWLSNTPLVTVNIDDAWRPELPDDVISEPLWFSMVHGYALRALTHPGVADEIEAHKSGLKAMAAYAREHKKQVRHFKEIRKVMRVSKKDKRLTRYLEDRL